MTSTGLEQYTATSSSSMRQDKDIFLIYIHALQNGLFRIHMEGNTGKLVKLSVTAQNSSLVEILELMYSMESR